MLTSHVGEDKWENIANLKSSWLLTTKWNGTKYPLEVFSSQYISKHAQLVEAAQHAQYQVPDEHTRVGYLIDNLEHQDPNLFAAISQIRTNAQGTCDEFEQSISILLPVNPFLKSVPSKIVSFDISSTYTTMYGRGKGTMVDLCWQKREEFDEISSEVKKKLRAWQNTSEGKCADKISRDVYFKDKGANNDGKHSGSKLESNHKKKLQRQVPSL